MLPVDPATLRNWVADGRIRYIRLPSGQLRFRRSDMEAVLQPIEPTASTA